VKLLDSRTVLTFGRSVAQTALSNIGSSAASGIAGIIIAQSLGATVRGEYAAIVAWFWVVLLVGELGQTAATTYFVARHPEHAADYLATSRVMMIASGMVTLTVGICVAPLLARGSAHATWGYRLMFCACLVAFAGASYVFGLQATNLARWNLLRISQPVLFVLAIVALDLLGRLALMTVLVALAATMTIQTLFAYLLCRAGGITGGRADRRLARPMTRYGLSQLAASTPTLVTNRLDQLVLSLTVVPAILGQYAVATSLTALAAPIVAAVGYVAFPRLASQALSRTGADRLQRWSLIGSAGIGIVFMLALALSASWLVPLVFGASFRDSVPLIWVLAPGGVFLTCAQVCGDLLRGHGRPLAVARAQWTAAGVTVVLLAVLLPVVGVMGAAITSTASYGLALTLMVRSLRARSADDDAAGNPASATDLIEREPGPARPAVSPAP
jgi:O-antigen/teichoic acid export membrane protein